MNNAFDSFGSAFAVPTFQQLSQPHYSLESIIGPNIPMALAPAGHPFVSGEALLERLNPGDRQSTFMQRTYIIDSVGK